MKASELIKILQNLVKEYGDRDVVFECDYSMHEIIEKVEYLYIVVDAEFSDNIEHNSVFCINHEE